MHQKTRLFFGKLKLDNGFPMTMSLVDKDDCLYIEDKGWQLYLIDGTNGKLKPVEVEQNMHLDKIACVEASHDGTFSVRTSNCFILTSTAFKAFDGKDFGWEVTSISHSHSSIAMCPGQEAIQVYSSKGLTN